ncbi:SatD family protein [Microbacterium sp. P05]|uniref:SatD family protein n=1 Tax=Microbacterium sp. P05 TaxID=3366948 RepID=UPI003745744F
MTTVVIADIVGSRRLPDRESAQRALDDTIARAERDHPLALQPLRPTVGDEQQGVYPSLDAALASVLLLQLALPDGVECRFGIGVGSVHLIESVGREIPEGPGWWAARTAIDIVHAKQQRAVPSARTWVVAAPEENDAMHSAVSLANAYLLARDHVVGAMNERARRLTYGRCQGVTQRALAESEGISQPAVSQALTGSGAPAVVEGFTLLIAKGRS